MPRPCTIAQTADLGLGRLRWSLGELADAVTALIEAQAAASWPPPAAVRPARWRRALIASVAMAAIALGGGLAPASAAFHSPARTLTGITWHGHHGRRRPGA